MKFIYLFLITSLVNAQIAITEVYSDTPHDEVLPHISQNMCKKHHRGEFIELYNYTDRDILLDGWYLQDYISKFYFPSNAVLKSQEYLVVVYREHNQSDDYFPTFFPSVVGKTEKIYYQSNIIIRNENEFIQLKTNKLEGNYITNSYFPSNIPINSVTTGQLKIKNSTKFNCNDIVTSNFYGNSFQLIKYNNFSHAQQDEYFKPVYQEFSPNPLSSNFVPPLRNYYETVVDILRTNYTLNLFTNGVDRILNNKCFEIIPLLEQAPPTETYQGIRCFTYDEAGNNINSTTCSNTTITPTPPTNQFDENILNEIAANIEIAPNPVINPIEEFTVFFKGVALGKINSVQVIPTDLSVAFPVINTTSTTEYVKINLGGKSNGLYVVRITLTTGQALTKSLIKM